MALYSCKSVATCTFTKKYYLSFVLYFLSLIVLLLIRKSIASLRRHIELMTEKLPTYHDDDDVLSTNSSSAASPGPTGSNPGGVKLDLDGVVTTSLDCDANNLEEQQFGNTEVVSAGHAI